VPEVANRASNAFGREPQGRAEDSMLLKYHHASSRPSEAVKCIDDQVSQTGMRLERDMSPKYRDPTAVVRQRGFWISLEMVWYVVAVAVNLNS